MMNSSNDDEEPLPDGWVLCQSKSVPGRIYYFNKKTGKSSWTKPQATEASPSTNKGKKEKSKKEEPEKKNLKRKSDGNHHEDTTPKKRNIRDIPTPGYKNTPKESPKKTPSTPITPISSIHIPVKNSASKRLQQLRKQITDDAQKEERVSDASQMKSPDKFKKELKASPKVTQTETQNRSTPKTFNTDLKSPTFNESRSSVNQSPSSDSLHSIPSPSQFFAANKILSSMKAQLPEEYCSKIKAKDSFADIDEAICNQTPEYPSTKHPATPPQFSEASKIVSAIKSKLSFRSLVNRDNKDVKVFASAKDRLDNLRTSLTKEAEDDSKDIGFEFSMNGPKKLFKADSVEAMDVDCRESKMSPQNSQFATKSQDIKKEDLVLVVDTNIFIHELDVIKNVLNSHIKGYSEQPTLLVPWRVINELDRLKDNNNGNGAICKRAKAAMDYLYQSLPENNRIKGQSLRDANSHIYPCELPDDEILNCSLQQAERGKSVILLSNDKNLCNKAIINGVKSIGLSELKGQLVNKLSECSDPDLHASVKHYEHCVYQLLANILENEMRAKYNTLWQHVLFKAPPWTLRDVLQCLLKHWLAVFNEVFPRIEHLITELKNSLFTIHDKNPKSLTKPEVKNFKELCLEVARKCQIIPEYLELAKLTVERITKKTDLDGNNFSGSQLMGDNLCGPQVRNHLNSNQVVANHLRSPQTRNHLNSPQVVGLCSPPIERSNVNMDAMSGADEMAVIGAFENVWTVFSSYCAKLSSGLGVSHSIEDKIPGIEPLPVLTNKWAIFSDQIYDFTDTIKGVLNVLESDPTLPEHVSRLEAVFRASLTLISADCSSITRDNLMLFCVKCRNMLREAYTKFTQLTELLEVCRNVMNK